MLENIIPLASEEVEQAGFLGDLVDISRHISHYIATFIGYIGLGVMLFGVIYSLILVARKMTGDRVVMGEIRLNLGHYLVLALEFLVAKDILESIFDPSLITLFELLLIVIIRSVLTYFLNKELKEVKEEIEEEMNKKK